MTVWVRCDPAAATRRDKVGAAGLIAGDTAVTVVGNLPNGASPDDRPVEKRPTIISIFRTAVTGAV